jgi:SecD/SecF fusion protein
MRGLKIGLGVGAAVVILAVGGVIVWTLFKKPTPDINTAGGTILVYELDESAPLVAGYEPDQLAAALKQRLDPADLYGVRVKPIDATRVEIAIPRSGDHATVVQDVKRLLSRVGALEFRIVANDHADKAAIEAVESTFRDASGKEAWLRLLEERANRGEVPPVSPDAALAGKPEKPEFETPLGKFTYAWVEVGPSMREDLKLGNAFEEEAPNWLSAKQAREKGETFRIGDNLFWSRKSANPLKPEESAEKKYEYFILTRESSPGKEITGKYLGNASEGIDSRNQPAINFRLDDRGAALFRELTSANKPVAAAGGKTGFQTQLAIILDGMVMSVPYITTTISGEGQLTGNFTKAEVERLVKVLRSGALPGRLKPQPVSETTIEPGKGGNR